MLNPASLRDNEEKAVAGHIFHESEVPPEKGRRRLDVVDIE